MNPTELSPCPFCGGPAKSNIGRTHVRCASENEECFGGWHLCPVGQWQNRTVESPLAPVGETPADLPFDLHRESLGRLVREVWIAWAMEQPNPKPSWLTPWEFLKEPDKEVDRRIGEAIRDAALKSLRTAAARPAYVVPEAVKRMMRWNGKNDPLTQTEVWELAQRSIEEVEALRTASAAPLSPRADAPDWEGERDEAIHQCAKIASTEMQRASEAGFVPDSRYAGYHDAAYTIYMQIARLLVVRPRAEPGETKAIETPNLDGVLGFAEGAVKWIPFDQPERDRSYRNIEKARAELAALQAPSAAAPAETVDTWEAKAKKLASEVGAFMEWLDAAAEKCDAGITKDETASQASVALTAASTKLAEIIAGPDPEGPSAEKQLEECVRRSVVHPRAEEAGTALPSDKIEDALILAQGSIKWVPTDSSERDRYHAIVKAARVQLAALHQAAAELDDPFPDEFQMDDAGVIAICAARIEARSRGEFPPTELQAYRLVCKQAVTIRALHQAASVARAAAIEECAKVCDMLAAELEADALTCKANPLNIIYPAHEVLKLQQGQASEAAARIRSLPPHARQPGSTKEIL